MLASPPARVIQASVPVVAILTADTLRLRFDEAGQTLMALPSAAPRLAFVVSRCLFPDDLDGEARPRPMRPTAAAVTRLDQVLDWIRLLPYEHRWQIQARQIVGLRLPKWPEPDREGDEGHVMSWRAIARRVGSNHETVKAIHERTLDRLVTLVNAALSQSQATQSWLRRDLAPACDRTRTRIVASLLPEPALAQPADASTASHAARSSR